MVIVDKETKNDNDLAHLYTIGQKHYIIHLFLF